MFQKNSRVIPTYYIYTSTYIVHISAEGDVTFETEKLRIPTIIPHAYCVFLKLWHPLHISSQMGNASSLRMGGGEVDTNQSNGIIEDLRMRPSVD